MNNTQSLHRQEFIYNGKINESITKFEVNITEFLRLNRGNNRPLLLRITSDGGVPEQIFGFCALLRQVKSECHPVIIHVLGQLCGFTYLLAAVADKIIMEPTASFVFGQMKFIKSGSVVDIASYLEYQQKQYGRLVDAIVARSAGKLDAQTVRSWKGRHITPDEAHSLGLCDEVLKLPTEPVFKLATKEVHHVRLNGTFSNDADIYDLQIALHIWMEKSENDGRPIVVYLTSWGGKVVQALSLYGLLCEAQRQGHHVTIHVMGEAYSCALWFATCALGSGTVLLDSYANLMFHAPSTEIECDLDDAPAKLSIELGVYKQTCDLLCRAEGFTADLLKSWENGPDRYITAEEAVQKGLGTLFTGQCINDSTAVTA